MNTTLRCPLCDSPDSRSLGPIRADDGEVLEGRQCNNVHCGTRWLIDDDGRERRPTTQAAVAKAR